MRQAFWLAGDEMAANGGPNGFGAVGKAVLVLLLLLPVGGHRALAFKGDEHERVADSSLALTERFLRVHKPWGDPSGVLAVFDSFGGEHASYGELTRSVDAMRSPHEFLSRLGRVDSLPAEPGHWSPGFLERSFVRSERHLRAAHNNDSHFQEEALHSFWQWHRIALGGASEGNLYGALVANALAEHYLHDFLAPGHVMTPRRNTPDVIALGVHDRYNQRGLEFVIDDERWAELEPLAKMLMDPAESWPAGRFEQVRLSGGRRLRLHGDGELHENADQEALQIVLGARSILDVVETFVRRAEGRQATNSFPWFEWYPRRLSEIDAAAEGAADGEPEADTLRRWWWFRKVNVRRPKAELPQGAYRFDDTSKMIQFSPALALGLERLSSSEQAIPGWNEANIEFVPYSIFGSPSLGVEAGTNRPLGKLNFAVGLGWAFARGDEFHGNGPRLRIIHAVPRLDLQFSAYVQRLEYHLPMGSMHRLDWGFQGEYGFSLLKARLGFGESGFGVTDSGELGRDVVFRAGLGLEVPVSRVPGLRAIERRLVKREVRKKVPGQRVSKSLDQDASPSAVR